MDKQITISKTDRQTDNSISLIRLISMCMIISCHIFQYLDCELAWWFNVGVQIFLCISGYLYSSKEINALPFLKRTFSKILSGYYIVSIPFLLVHLFVLKSIGLKEIVLSMLLATTIPGGGHLWFVPTILCCYFVTPFLFSLYKDCSKKQIHITTFCALIITFIVFSLFIPRFNPAWISCYIMGYYLGKIGKNKCISWTIIILGIITNITQCISDYIIELPIPMYSYFCNYAHMFLGISLFIILRHLFRNLKGCKLLKFSDEYSYYIYLVHQFFILGPISLMNLTKYVSINIFIILVIVIILAVVLKKFSYKSAYVLNKIQHKIRWHLNRT